VGISFHKKLIRSVLKLLTQFFLSGSLAAHDIYTYHEICKSTNAGVFIRNSHDPGCLIFKKIIVIRFANIK